ncbi:hypothetical protein [Colwellia sp. MEBiC06753]
MEVVIFNITIAEQESYCVNDLNLNRSEKVRLLFKDKLSCYLTTLAPVHVKFDHDSKKAVNSNCFPAIAIDESKAAMLMYGRIKADGWIQVGKSDSDDVYRVHVSLEVRKKHRKVPEIKERTTSEDTQSLIERANIQLAQSHRKL